MEEQFLNQNVSTPKEKKGKTIAIIILSILLVVSVITSTILIIQGKKSYDHLNEKYKAILSSYNLLENDYNSLKSDYENLTSEYHSYLEEAAIVYDTPSDLSEYDTGITYDNLARTPDDYEGKAVKFTGTVLQVIDGTDTIGIRLAVNDDYNNTLFGAYNPIITSQRILENDTITIYGLSANLYSYESTLGELVTVPFVWIDHLELLNDK